MTKAKPKHVFKLVKVVMPTYTDEPDIEFENPLRLTAHIQAAYPDHVSFIVVGVVKDK